MKENYVCGESGVNAQDLEDLAGLESLRRAYADGRIDEVTGDMFMGNFKLNHGNRFGNTCEEISNYLLGHMMECRTCAKIYSEYSEEQRRVEKEVLEEDRFNVRLGLGNASNSAVEERRERTKSFGDEWMKRLKENLGEEKAKELLRRINKDLDDFYNNS